MTAYPPRQESVASSGIIGTDPLLTPGQAAQSLDICMKTLFGHVRDGALRYINVGRGSKKPRRMFDPIDLADFRQSRKRIEAPCRFIGRKPRPSTNTTSKCEVVAFTALQSPRADGKPKR